MMLGSGTRITRIFGAILAYALLGYARAEEGEKTVHNWMRTYEYTPSVIVRPPNLTALAAIVKDTQQYPSPLRAYGSFYSPSECVVNEGTVVEMKGLDRIKGLSTDSLGRQVVTVEGGVTLLKLQTWLGPQGRELAYASFIGDATVGSLAVSVSKDSGIGPLELSGTVYKSVVGVTYVDHNGEVVTLKDTEHPEKLAAFKSSDGQLGIVGEATLVTVPTQLVTYTYQAFKTDEVIAALLNGTFAANLTHNAIYMMRPDYSLLRSLRFADTNAWESRKSLVEAWQNGTRNTIATAKYALVGPDEKTAQRGPMSYTTYRYNSPTHYEEVKKGQVGRGDGTWMEFPFDKLSTVLPAFFEFWRDFKMRNTGFEAEAAAVFIVPRIADKPYGWFSQQGEGFDKPGLSFTLDPVYGLPDDPRWQAYVKECVAFAVKHGGRLSLTQTRFVTREAFLSRPGQKPLPETPNSRFTSAYFRQFI